MLREYLSSFAEMIMMCCCAIPPMNECLLTDCGRHIHPYIKRTHASTSKTLYAYLKLNLAVVDKFRFRESEKIKTAESTPKKNFNEISSSYCFRRIRKPEPAPCGFSATISFCVFASCCVCNQICVFCECLSFSPRSFICQPK
jgi:hypothetical protein